MQTDLISEGQRARLLENGTALQSGERHISQVVPIVRLYDTCGNGEWLIAGLDPADEDVAIGLAASGRAGGLLYAHFRLSQLMADCERGGRAITRDRYFRAAQAYT